MKILEYQGLLGMLAEKALSPPGAGAALALSPDSDAAQAQTSWRLTEEARALITQKGLPDIGGHLDVSPYLEHLLKPGASLGPEELNLIGQEAQAIEAAWDYFQGAAAVAPGLGELAARLVPESDLSDRLRRSLGPEGEVLDTASPALARLRAEQTVTRQALVGKLNGLMQTSRFRNFIQDELVTDRGGRFVVPVKAAAVSSASGLVHDWSQSGATAFLEPLEAVEDNNRLGLARRREREEIQRILADLSRRCAQAAPGLLASGRILTELDLYLAKAELAKALNAVAPECVPGAGLYLKGARHPLLARHLSQKGLRITPLDIMLNPAEPMLIISGLNTGGKTVALKTLGLLMLMAKSGLMIPAGPDSRLDLMSELLVVIGDEQDLAADLSTFSGHVKSLIKVLRQVTPDTLVLLDELGSGTDPAEGSALALAVLSRLRDSGAYVLAATHYQQVKAWAMVTDKVVIAAVNTGADGRPAYGLSYGHPGFSGGLAMARRLGFEEELITLAESYLDDGERETSALLARLDTERGALAAARADFEEQAAKLARAEQELTQERRRLTDEYHRLGDKVNREARGALARAEAEFASMKSELKAALAQAPATGQEGLARWKMELDLKKAQTVKDLKKSLPQPIDDGRPLSQVRPGDRVLVKKLGKVGLVAGLEKNEALIQADGLNIRARLRDLYAPPQPGRQPPARFNYTLIQGETADVGLSLNLLGRTVEEALAAIDKGLDQASLKGRSSLSIIHGFGTGRLRQAVRGYLKGHPLVKDFKAAENRGGGEGVTVVELFD